MSQRLRAPRRRDEIERWLDLYHDGELKGLRRWWFERLLRRNPGLHRDLAVRDQLRSLIRETAGASETPDLWGSIANQVAAHAPPERMSERERRAASPRSLGGWLSLPPWLSPARLGPALAGVAAVAVFYAIPVRWTSLGGVESAAADNHGVVRSISSQGRPVVVLEGSDEATIIWLMDSEGEAEEEQADGVQV